MTSRDADCRRLDKQRSGSSRGGFSFDQILSEKVLAGTFAAAAERLSDLATARTGGYVVLCNVHVLMTAARNTRLASALRDATLVLPDGAPIAWLQRRAGHGWAERSPGPDLMAHVIRHGAEKQIRHGFVGSTPETLRRLTEAIQRQTPAAEVVGALSPPFGDGSRWRDEVIAEVKRWEADILWVALGAPKQELWMNQNADALAPALLVGVGAAFDFHAQLKPRAPAWMQERGLEWTFRLATEPKRLAGRYLRTNTAFVWAIASDAVRRRIGNETA